MQIQLWRVRPAAAPVWESRCPRCHQLGLDSTGRFRVNANGARHDVWLLYRCPSCRATHKRRVLRRVRADAAPLDRYRADDASLAARCAFGGESGALPVSIECPPIVERGSLCARIEQPLDCGMRWDRLLAQALEWSRARVVAEWRAGRVRVDGVPRCSRTVRDGQRVVIAFDDS